MALRSVRCFLIAATLLTATLAAHADTVQTFALSGSLFGGAPLTGTLQIDTTLGKVTAIDANLGSPLALTFTAVSSQGQPELSQYDVVSNSGTNQLELVFSTASLIGYSGGSLSSYSQSTGFDSDLSVNGAFYNDLEVGAVSSTATPEPSTLLLLGTGLLGGAGTCLRRLRASRAA